MRQSLPQSLPELSLSFAPGANLPLGDEASYFSYGADAALSGTLSGILPVVSPRVSLGYDYITLATLGGVHMMYAEAGLDLPLDLAPKLPAIALPPRRLRVRFRVGRQRTGRRTLRQGRRGAVLPP